ncbi:MAG TPA: bifunctional diaminohydroxyphosphoribosylaminopyrimidine deaminase/5-amino-6-(5-phosphoribosylamino)uracil reductase RibD [Chitinophagales bacterium]|nr:bifunctional diaminohydroxyphosphoribosylaminopyrimidine deaminase/5-amino-6-(5-phosphoribosylamino)uracil reductase RibD [Chitinophagales bacterium]HNG27370.1 bifunctional diaminohydroxyphosphoribosylaminopyrimidine deaminase/5-amino-6-(5-phosphoribosylamino)uracil reductase RibD [Chitinophagales bacterium]HNI02322.1 bifunctional diaminohydroxyphosphoribosylaminopyrimidine deaminase/5-amino-6-(5-phosphoribosylamino)uracil reductase RibD [Chitinophagales bacterium]HNJ60072.1 bifunctional diam
MFQKCIFVQSKYKITKVPTDELYMQRCFELAQLGEGFVAPNPLVGSILVYKDRIIGEGYHQKFGTAHAEVNCINSVHEVDKKFIKESTLYVSLEPCSHFGKTPPCADLIIQQQIKKVIISVLDPNPLVAGNGIKKLENAGINVEFGLLQEDGQSMIEKFIWFHQQQMPFVTLKYAQSADGFIGQNNKTIAISNKMSQRLVHQLRATHQAILIGNNTLKTDNPLLNVRYAKGNNPIKIILCRDGNVDMNLNIFQDISSQIIIINELKETKMDNFHWLKVEDIYNVESILKKLYAYNIQSILVEGGAKILKSFIAQNQWNEIIQIKAKKRLVSGIEAPAINFKPYLSFDLAEDKVYRYRNL